MSLFSKSINTKRDHHAEMKSAISDAINTALKNGVLPGAIQRELESHAADFRRAEEARIEKRMRDPNPQMFDPLTYAPIDSHGEIARREERRMKEDLRRQQKEYRDAVNERGRRDAIRRGEVL